MESTEAVRRTVRHCSDEPLAPELVDRVLDAAHPDLAPQDTTGTAGRRRRTQDVVHRGQW